ncbi:MAG: hypothetical protein ACYDDV_10205 [Methanoregula sp.]
MAWGIAFEYRRLVPECDHEYNKKREIPGTVEDCYAHAPEHPLDRTDQAA